MQREKCWQLTSLSCHLWMVRISAISSSTLSCLDQTEFTLRSDFTMHFCKLKKDHERFVAAESIPVLLTISSKIQNSVVPLLFQLIINFFDLTVWTKYHMSSIRQDSHNSSDKLIFKICINLPFTTCLEVRYKHISIIRLGCKPLEFPVNSDTISQCTFWVSVFTCSFKWLLITFAVKKPRQFRHLWRVIRVKIKKVHPSLWI